LTVTDDFRACWGKARAEPEWVVFWHPIAHHLLDVAAVAGAVLLVRPRTLQRAARLLTLPEDDARNFLIALIALHDIGKFAPAFEMKAPEYWPETLYGPLDPASIVNGHHTTDGMVLWTDELAAWAVPRLWNGAHAVLAALAPAIFGHHGRPTGTAHRTSAIARYHRPALAAARACADAILTLLMPSPIASPPPGVGEARRATWWISGLTTVADWIGSSPRWFPYTAPLNGDVTLQAYWELAKSRAREAVREAGLVFPAPAAPKTLPELTGKAFAPTPAQEWAASAELPDGPTLIILEDVTGAGKTEAAQMLVHRLMARKRSLGVFWAMPTQATANAMYTRQAETLDRFYDGSEVRPSLVLSHGQQRLHSAFRASVLDGAGDPRTTASSTSVTEIEDLDGTATCTSWLADDRRAALLADMGAGTIDQALLGILPSRFNTVRLFGLADKVLVVDEAHAYDAYMNVELEELLRFHAALGGNAVVLSATLPRTRRAQLAMAWREGVLGGQRRLGERIEVSSDAYPLGTVVGGETTDETPLAPSHLCRRTVPVRLVHDIRVAADYVAQVARSGAAVAWIRNTVDDCLAAAALLRDELDTMVFHARFAQCDRQKREQEVLACFGKESSAAGRRGRVLIATQVIEQSLDLDFDAMVSDLAPIDLLVQRTGRLRRHDRPTGRPDGVACGLVVLSPVPDENPPNGWLGGAFAGTSHIYADAGVLWRTVRTLHRLERITTPDGLRELIESVYGDDAAPVPASLEESASRAEGIASGQAAVATLATLKVKHGYDASGHAWESELRARTRLGDEQTTVRLARVMGGGELAPWSRDSNDPPWKAWALSEIRLSRKVPRDAMADPLHDKAVAAVRGSWGRFEQEIPLLPLREEGGVWVGRLLRPDGKPIAVRYRGDTGLAYERTGD
jgi:CRISPR-associated endonuclease/helicase Cas3